MCKIWICYEEQEFENDIYELVKAFYPFAEITKTEGGVPGDDWELLLTAQPEGQFTLRWKNGEEKGVCASSTVQSSEEDRVALLSCSVETDEEEKQRQYRLRKG